MKAKMGIAAKNPDKLDSMLSSVKNIFCSCSKSNRGEGYTGLILSMATILVIAAFVAVPQLRQFANTIFNAMSTWWTGTIASRIFPTS